VSYGKFPRLSRLAPRCSLCGDFARQVRDDPEMENIEEWYAPGTGIGWRRDKSMFEKVVALSFLQPWVLRLREKDGRRWQRSRELIEARSCYSLSGEVRDGWEHSIEPMKSFRYSVTFRTFRRDYERPASDAV